MEILYADGALTWCEIYGALSGNFACQTIPERSINRTIKLLIAWLFRSLIEKLEIPHAYFMIMATAKQFWKQSWKMWAKVNSVNTHTHMTYQQHCKDSRACIWHSDPLHFFLDFPAYHTRKVFSMSRFNLVSASDWLLICCLMFFSPIHEYTKTLSLSLAIVYTN